MSNTRVIGIRSVELGVRDLERTAAFYRDVWGLEAASSDGDTIHMRGTGAEHHVLTLRQRPKTSLLGFISPPAIAPRSMRYAARPGVSAARSRAIPPSFRPAQAGGTASGCARPTACR